MAEGEDEALVMAVVESLAGLIAETAGGAGPAGH
jgi:hypothetical protein